MLLGERLVKAIENSNILLHHRAAGQGKCGPTFDQLIESQHEVLGWETPRI
jgi:hypothetical protein